MKDAQAQFPLALFDARRVDFNDFYGTNNQSVCEALRRWADGEAHWCVNIWGAAGVGKSHLLQAAIRHAHHAGRVTMYVPLAEVLRFGPGVLENLERIETLAIDDLDLAAGDEAWEVALFALYNRCAAANSRWLFSAKSSPRNMPIKLPDLHSRLSAALIYQMSEPEDLEKQQILRALAHARGLELSAAVASFLMRRLPRSMHALIAAIDQLDMLSLSTARPLTVPFVREVLKLSAED